MGLTAPKKLERACLVLCVVIGVLIAICVTLMGFTGVGVTRVSEQHVCRHCGANREVRSIEVCRGRIPYHWTHIAAGPYRAMHFGVFGRPGGVPCARHAWLVTFSSGRGWRNWDGPAG